MIDSGSTNDSWRSSLFCMLPKSGDLTLPENYRPIAILQAFYKIFSRMLYGRLMPLLDSHQCHDQFGFRPGVRLDDALVVLETMISKTREWNMPLWVASLDLKKAFDKITFSSIFAALRAQSISEYMIALLLDLYANQHGCISGTKLFAIHRGVKQGDVISSIIFNATIEHVFQKWKMKLASHGWLLDSSHSRLTNIRYADDMMLFAKSASELHQMLVLLHDELQIVGLEMHPTKTKVMTTYNDQGLLLMNIRGMEIQILGDDASHRYLGRLVTLSTNRCTIEVSNRLRAAWGKFAQHHKWLTNQQVSLHLRLKLFDSVVSPTALFATSSLPLTSAHFSRLGRAQRKMLRCIVGWVRIDDEPWSDTMHRMRNRMDRAAKLYFVQPWSIRLLRSQWSFACHLSTLRFSSWPSLALH